MRGVVVKVLAGVVTVNIDGDNKELECGIKGRLKLEDYPTVGDLVLVENVDDYPLIKEILPRNNILDRPRIANVDQIFIFMAAMSPEPNNYLIDRLTVLGEYWGLDIVIGFNKSDLNKTNLSDIYRQIGYNVYEFSLINDDNIVDLSSILKDKITVLAGPSGVGKTTFVNKLLGKNRDTALVSKKTQRGKHTTRVVELLSLPFGGYIADTPGFSRLDVLLDDSKTLSSCFVEFRDNQCRFQDCLHLKEPGCSVKEKIHPLRYLSYQNLLVEIEEMKPW